jgi:replicative DNA helicase
MIRSQRARLRDRPAPPLSEELRREGVLEQAGGMTFISELTYGLPHFTNVAAYAKVIKDFSVMRQLVKVCNKATSEALEGDGTPIPSSTAPSR